MVAMTLEHLLHFLLCITLNEVTFTVILFMIMTIIWCMVTYYFIRHPIITYRVKSNKSNYQSFCPDRTRHLYNIWLLFLIVVLQVLHESENTQHLDICITIFLCLLTFLLERDFWYNMFRQNPYYSALVLLVILIVSFLNFPSMNIPA